MSTNGSPKRRRALFDRLDERLCGKRLGQVGDAPDSCGCAVRLAVVPGDIITGSLPCHEATAQLSRIAVQVDVKDEAKASRNRVEQWRPEQH